MKIIHFICQVFFVWQAHAILNKDSKIVFLNLNGEIDVQNSIKVLSLLSANQIMMGDPNENQAQPIRSLDFPQGFKWQLGFKYTFDVLT